MSQPIATDDPVTPQEERITYPQPIATVEPVTPTEECITYPRPAPGRIVHAFTDRGATRRAAMMLDSDTHPTLYIYPTGSGALAGIAPEVVGSVPRADTTTAPGWRWEWPNRD